MNLAECKLQIAAQLGGPGWEAEVRAAWEAVHTHGIEAQTLSSTLDKDRNRLVDQMIT